MKTEMCLVICFLVGVLVFYILKQSCGCKTVEGIDGNGNGGNGINSYNVVVSGSAPAPGQAGDRIDASQCTQNTVGQPCGPENRNGKCVNMFGNFLCGMPDTNRYGTNSDNVVAPGPAPAYCGNSCTNDGDCSTATDGCIICTDGKGPDGSRGCFTAPGPAPVTMGCCISSRDI